LPKNSLLLGDEPNSLPRLIEKLKIDPIIGSNKANNINLSFSEFVSIKFVLTLKPTTRQKIKCIVNNAINRILDSEFFRHITI